MLDWPVVIRSAAEQDLTAILEIQSAAPEASQWNPRDYLSYECLVAEQDGAVVGFLVARQAAEGEWELLNLAVAPAVRRQGVGLQLLRDVIERHQGQFFLELRESNAAARGLYERAGFHPITKRSQYYANPVETAIVMKLYS
jgi:ribosomal-protein-alanine N-acetyltransferase